MADRDRDTAPFPPMEAQPADDIPAGAGWQYEPKWDGFRGLAVRDGAAIALWSKSGQPLGRYFPDVIAALGALDATRFVLDGEIVIPAGDGLSFEALQLRLHPAASRVAKLAAAQPARFVLFDLLGDAAGRDLRARPLAERRAALERFAARHLPPDGPVRLSPVSTDLAQARHWLTDAAHGLDGVVAKRLDRAYDAGGRHAMQKIKPLRSADCVVGGFRYATGSHEVGSLLLGLYDGAGLLHHVGFTATLPRAERPALTARLERLIEPPGFTGDAPGGPSRWSSARSADWRPLRPELVVEVRYDHVTGGRFRHGTTLLRWRPDKAPRQCGCDQLRPGGGRALPSGAEAATMPARKPSRGRRHRSGTEPARRP